jgi:hypothetical protein
MSKPTYSDRSQTLAFRECPRKWWLMYGIPNKEKGSSNGIVPDRLNMDLLVGTCNHLGVEGLYRGYEIDDIIDLVLNGKNIDGTPELGGFPGYWPLVKSHGLMLLDNEDAGYVYREQAALIEALIRAYWWYVYPSNMERFEVVEIEKDGYEDFWTPEGIVRWGYRTDALFMEKDSLDLYVLSLKTPKKHGYRDESSAHHDMQGLSEWRALERRLERWHKALKNGVTEEDIPHWFSQRFSRGHAPLIMGVKMEHSLKGERSEWPKGSGQWTYSNPLIRPWKNYKTNQYAWKFNYQDELGGWHKLGKDWKRINIWEDMGVQKWVEILATSEVQGFPMMKGIEEQFSLPGEYFRNEEDMDEWEESTMPQAVEREHWAEDARTALRIGDIKGYFRILNRRFYKDTRSCDWPVKCVFQDVCHSGVNAYTLDPRGIGKYKPRESNHEAERGLIQIK